MARSIAITTPPDKTDALVEAFKAADGVVGISLQRATSLKPPGDVLTVQATNEGMESVRSLLDRHGIDTDATVMTSEPRSLLSPSSQRAIDEETNEASWDEMAMLLRRETNVTANYVMAMLFAGAVAAAGLFTDTVHIVVGAMVIAPGFEPIIRLPFGLLGGDRRGALRALGSTAAGYAAMAFGAALALVILRMFDASTADLSERDWIRYWTSIEPASVVIALAASAAGAAIIAAQRSVLTAGVMIALALVPAMSIVGMALAAGEVDLAGEGLIRWALDAACVVLAGGLIFMIKRGQHRWRSKKVNGTAPRPARAQT